MWPNGPESRAGRQIASRIGNRQRRLIDRTDIRKAAPNDDLWSHRVGRRIGSVGRREPRPARRTADSARSGAVALQVEGQDWTHVRWQRELRSLLAREYHERHVGLAGDPTGPAATPRVTSMAVKMTEDSKARRSIDRLELLIHSAVNP